MSRQYGGFVEMDTMSVGTHSDWSKCSELLNEHESLAMAGCADMNDLLSWKIDEHQVSPLLANQYTKMHLADFQLGLWRSIGRVLHMFRSWIIFKCN